VREITGDQSISSVQSYDGDWLDGEMSGFGTFTWPSGNVYEGEWLSNRRHGLGKLTDSTGKVRQRGFWQMGKLLR
jgi:hypothetical protein